MKLGGVLLAAGLGRRFGGNKLAFPLEGKSLFDRAMAAVPAHLFTRAAVVSGYDALLAAAADGGYLPVRNEDPARGISHSIHLGLNALGEMDAVLFAVCDQPRLTRASVMRLIAAHRADGARIAALSWAGRRGSPVIFPREYFPALLDLTGDRGGSVVIARNLDNLIQVAADSAEELCDLDDTAALESFTKT